MSDWVLMLVMSCIIPLIMLAFGAFFKRGGAKEPNWAFGYRTFMSMKNKDTWKFAHEYCGKLWYKLGWIMLLVTLAAMFLMRGDDQRTNLLGTFIMIAQIASLLLTIIIVELALKRKFDKDGNRKHDLET